MKNLTRPIATIIMMASACIANAAVVSFDQAVLLDLTVVSSVAATFRGSDNKLDAGPGSDTYENNFGFDSEFMSGVAGANEDLAGNSGGVIYYGSSGLSLAAGDKFRILGANDNNNDNWIIGVWSDVGAGIVEQDYSTVAAGSTNLFEFTATGDETNFGIFVKAPMGLNDVFHVSWSESVPEPASLGLLGLGLLGLGTIRRRRNPA